MMWWYGGSMMIVFWGLLIGAAVALSRYFAAQRERAAPPSRAPTAEEVLAERFARGEIDADEYQRRLGVLLGDTRRGTVDSQPPVAGTDGMVAAAPSERDQRRQWP